MRSKFRGWMIFPMILGGMLTLTGCEEKGPAQKAGENIDNAAKNAADAVNPKGPGERAGEKVDDALKK